MWQLHGQGGNLSYTLKDNKILLISASTYFIPQVFFLFIGRLINWVVASTNPQSRMHNQGQTMKEHHLLSDKYSPTDRTGELRYFCHVLYKLFFSLEMSDVKYSGILQTSKVKLHQTHLETPPSWKYTIVSYKY